MSVQVFFAAWCLPILHMHPVNSFLLTYFYMFPQRLPIFPPGGTVFISFPVDFLYWLLDRHPKPARPLVTVPNMVLCHTPLQLLALLLLAVSFLSSPQYLLCLFCCPLMSCTLLIYVHASPWILLLDSSKVEISIHFIFLKYFWVVEFFLGFRKFTSHFIIIQDV